MKYVYRFLFQAVGSLEKNSYLIFPFFNKLINLKYLSLEKKFKKPKKVAYFEEHHVKVLSK